MTQMDFAPKAETVEDFGTGAGAKARRWISEIELAERASEPWRSRCRRIIERYAESEPRETRGRRFALFWANIETLKPATLARAPVAVVGRRFKDEDPIGRLASEVLERALNFALETTDVAEVLAAVRDDLLLTARGAAWVRYVPHLVTVSAGSEPMPGSDGQVGAGAEPYDIVAWEEAVADHVAWDDFLHNPAREWAEVRWVARRAFMTREELIARFGEETGRVVPLDHAPEDAGGRDDQPDQWKKAAVWEIWDNRWTYTAFANSAGAWLIAANGTDPPVGYNGVGWAALPTLSGSSGPITLNPSALFNVFPHKGRLYYLEQGSLRAWNPAAGAVGGACTLWDLSPVFSKGGRLVCGANWSGQVGLTTDDFAVFMTDQGQLAVYQVVDPASASSITLIGVFDLGPPLGPKAMIKFGGDLAIVTADGVLPLSQAIRLDRSQENMAALTTRIANAFSAAVRAYGGNYGWQGLLYPSTTAATDATAVGGSLAIFNVPVTSLGTSVQFVQNVLTGAWCRFTGIDAYCWELANGAVFFGASDGVYQWDRGSSDNGVYIVGDVKTAFTDFGEPGRQKRFTLIRPTLSTTSQVAPALEVDVDYQESAPVAVPTVVSQGLTGAQVRYDWTGASGVGHVGAARMQVRLVGDTGQPNLAVGDIPPHDLAIDSSGDGLLVQSGLPFDVPCRLFGFDVVYERGGVL